MWRGGPFAFQSAGTPLAELLRDFGAHHGIPTVVSAQVDDRFIGTLPPGAAQTTLDTLAERYRLSWYFNGQTLNIYKASEATRRVLPLRYASPRDLLAHLHDAGVLHPRHCVARAIPATHALEIAGVPACVETVSMLADYVERDARDQQESEETIKIFPLKFATADDTRYFYRGQEVVVPGVVSVLKDLIQGAGPLIATSSTTDATGAAPVPERRPTSASPLHHRPGHRDFPPTHVAMPSSCESVAATFPSTAISSPNSTCALA